MIRWEMSARDISKDEIEALDVIFGGDFQDILWGEDGKEMNDIVVQLEKK